MNILARAARKGLAMADDFCAAVSPASQEGVLVTVLFHSILRDASQFHDSELAPGQNLTVEEFRRFVGVMLEAGYVPVSPQQVDAGLKPRGRYVMLTFDDGYFNNTLALDVLAQFHAPATFFVSSDHLLHAKGFWWDALGRELAGQGLSARARSAEIERMKLLPGAQIEARLKELFGADVLRPRSDLDRPFTPAELKDFAAHSLVHIGNHTHSHAILPRCSAQQMAREIETCQQTLESITGRRPLAIAYPNGDYSGACVQAAQDAGLRIGLTVRPRRTSLPLLDAHSKLVLGRFLVWGGQDLHRQCRKFGAGFIPSHAIKSLMMSGHHAS